MLSNERRYHRIPLANQIQLLFLLLLAGCNPLYVIEAAIHEGQILANRIPIEKVITEGKSTAQDVRALTFVKEARAFANERGLSVGDAFSSFSPTDEDSVVWVVMGCKPDSFEAKSWWFPIVGRVPYKGFFSKDDALMTAKELQDEGFETFVRGATAFSTLGWFNDPVLTPLLSHQPTLVVNTIIHELVHRTVWIPEDVSFNESLANYLGHAETLAFFLRRHPQDNALSNDATQRLAREIGISALSEKLYQQLSTIYASSSPRDEKLRNKRASFAKADATAKEFELAFDLFSRANNAEFLQVYLYFRQLAIFDALYRHRNGDLRAFLDDIRRFQRNLSRRRSAGDDLFSHFERYVRSVIDTSPRHSAFNLTPQALPQMRTNR